MSALFDRQFNLFLYLMLNISYINMMTRNRRGALKILASSVLVSERQSGSSHSIQFQPLTSSRIWPLNSASLVGTVTALSGWCFRWRTLEKPIELVCFYFHKNIANNLNRISINLNIKSAT